MNVISKLLDYNTELTLEDREAIADRWQEVLNTLELVRPTTFVNAEGKEIDGGGNFCFAEDCDDTAEAVYSILTEMGNEPKAIDKSDPRDVFERYFPIPPGTGRCGDSYTIHAYDNWDGSDYIQKWLGWKACLTCMNN